MKKLFIYILSIILIIASCAKVDDMSERFSTQGREITFTVANTNSPVTKAIVDTTAMVDTFGVYGYVVPGDFSVNGGYLMKNAEYDKDGNAVDGPYYWPKSDNYTGIDFIFTAYSQYVSAPTWDGDTLKLAVPTLTQALIDNPEDFNDVLWAQTKYNHHQDGNVGAEHEKVALNFRHALSWLQFKGEVTNPNVKWVKVKQISFGEYRDSIPGVPAVAEIPAYDDTTDTWVNLKRTSDNTIGSASKTRVKNGDTWGNYVDNFEIPASLVAEIKSYYSINGGEAGNYDLHLNNTNWPSADIWKLRVVKDIPNEYKKTFITNCGGIDFFDALTYLKDNGYDITYTISGGKPEVFNYPIIDMFVNGSAFTVVGFNYAVSSVYDAYAKEYISPVGYTIVHHDAVPGTPGVAPVPASGSEGLFVDGFLCLPTKDTLTATPVATYGTVKDTTLNYLSAQVDTLFTNDNKVLGNTLIIPQPVPQNITVVFDICIANPNADDVVFTDRKITRTINTGKDADKDANYVASWGASNKYIYYFNFNGDILDFTVSIADWTLSDTDFHVWDY